MKKRTVEETENVEAALRKERIDVEQRGRTKRGRDERGAMR